MILKYRGVKFQKDLELSSSVYFEKYNEQNKYFYYYSVYIRGEVQKVDYLILEHRNLKINFLKTMCYPLEYEFFENSLCVRIG